MYSNHVDTSLLMFNKPSTASGPALLHFATPRLRLQPGPLVSVAGAAPAVSTAFIGSTSARPGAKSISPVPGLLGLVHKQRKQPFWKGKSLEGAS